MLDKVFVGIYAQSIRFITVLECRGVKISNNTNTSFKNKLIKDAINTIREKNKQIQNKNNQ